VRIVVAAVLAAAADSVLVAHQLPIIGAHLLTAQPVEEMAWRQEARGRKKRGVVGDSGDGGDAAAAGDKQLGSCAAGQMKYTTLCVQWKVKPRGDVPLAS
jgi:hypothetical protein